MTTRHAFITAHAAAYPVRVLCRLLGVARSWFCAKAACPDGDRQESGREGARRCLLTAIRRIFNASRGTYGAPRIHAELRSEGLLVSRKTVAKLMKENDISPPRRKKRKPVTTNSNHAHGIAPNLLERRFGTTVPNTVWLADITYCPTPSQRCEASPAGQWTRAGSTSPLSKIWPLAKSWDGAWMPACIPCWPSAR